MKKRNISCKEAAGWIFAGVSLIMLINSVRLCFSNDIWYDELFTMGMVEHSYGELIGFTARDVHPPLYYFIAKFFLDLCKLIFPLADSVMIVKLVSVLPYFLLFVYALTFVKKRFGIFVSGTFMFCILAMPQMSAYTVEMRMYGWALFFVTATFFHAYDISCVAAGISTGKGSNDEIGYGEIGNKVIGNGETKNDGIGNNEIRYSGAKKIICWNYVAIFAYGLAAAYTQYFACVAVIMVYLYLFIWVLMKNKKYIKGWLACAALSVLGYLPWLVVLVSQIAAVRSNYWILPLTWRSIGGCVKFLMKPAFQKEELNVILAVLLFLLYAALLVIYGFAAWKEWRKGAQGHEDTSDTACGQGREDAYDAEYATFCYALAGCLVLCGLVIFGFIASIIIRPIFVYRYMLPAVGCFWLCFVLCLDNFCKLSHLPSYICIIIIVLVVGMRDYRAFMGEEEYRAVLMEETQQAFSDIAQTDIILYNFDQLQAVCGYYLAQESYLWNAEPEQLIVDMFGNKGSIQGISQIEQWLDEGKTVWFFGSFNSREDIRSEWEKDGIETEETGSYMLERYWFNIYKVCKTL